jgi:ATP-dependent helicase/nuclease subunit B
MELRTVTIRLETTTYGVPALMVLARVVGDVKRDDPMTPVTVIIPNNVAGIVARRYLAGAVTAGGGPAVGPRGHRRGIAAIELTTLARLSERIAAPRLAPRRPTARAFVAAAWRAELAKNPRGFRDIAGHPATIRALVAAHAELRDVSEAGCRAIAGVTDVGRDLVELHAAVLARLATQWYDSADLLAAAAEQCATQRLGACVLYLPQDLRRAEASFAASLGTSGELIVIAGFTGVQRADGAVERTLARLEAPQQAKPRRPATASRVLNASDSDDEVRVVVRDVVLTLERTPAHRVAILYSAPIPYARLLHEQLGAAGVTANGAGVRAADERAIARAILELLALADNDVARADLFRALANAPVNDFAGTRIPLSAWERISCAAGIVSGEDWQNRLSGYIASRRAEAQAESAETDPKRGLIERFHREADAAVDLQAFALRLREELLRAATLTSWRELSTWCLELFETVIGAGTTLTRLPVEEQYAAAAIVSVLRSLGGMDGVDAAPTLQRLRDVLSAELAGALPRVGRFGNGVFVGPISHSIGLDLDVVYVVGLSEDLFPGHSRADALLCDRARLATRGELPSRRERLHSSHRQLLAAFASAREAVASFPRGDLRRSSRRLPSRFLLPTLRQLSGDHGLAATAWDEPATYADRVRTAGSFAGELLRTDLLSTGQEWRTRQASAAGTLDDDVVRAAVTMIRARASDQLSRFDGNLTGVDGLPDYARDHRPVSPTALESYAQCPHAFFIERLLGVRQLERPEEVVEISSQDIGNLIHDSVATLVSENAGALPGPGEPWSADQHRRLVEIAVERAEDFRRRGLTGHPRMWERERDRIVNDIALLLEDDDSWRALVGARVLASELPFGLRGSPPVEVEIAGGRVLMRGSADRVDQGSDGTLYVTDIKSGSRRRFAGITQQDPLAGGTKLQLPIYGYAARRQFGDRATPVTAAYWFVRKAPGRLSLELSDTVERAYSDALAVITRSIASGLFPPKAPASPDFLWVQCDCCNPDGIGHAENRERWERKRHDPVLGDLVRLIDADQVEDR